MSEKQQMQKHRSMFSPLFEMPMFGMHSPFEGTMMKRKGEMMDICPSMDICEDDKKYMVHCDLPGMKKEDIKVKMEKNMITICGERKEEKEEKNVDYHRCERRSGKFFRSFTLPKDCDPKTMKAKYVNGVLDICINKEQQDKEESMDINIE